MEGLKQRATVRPVRPMAQAAAAPVNPHSHRPHTQCRGQAGAPALPWGAGLMLCTLPMCSWTDTLVSFRASWGPHSHSLPGLGNTRPRSHPPAAHRELVKGTRFCGEGSSSAGFQHGGGTIMMRNISNKPQCLAAPPPPAQPLRSDAPPPPGWGAGRGGQPGAGFPALNMCCCPPSFPEQWTWPSGWARCWPHP